MARRRPRRPPAPAWEPTRASALAPAWEPARAEAARLSETRRAAEESLVQALVDSGSGEAVARAAAIVENEPLREKRWALLALAQYRTGRQGDALRSISRARRVLTEQLGVDPGHELVHLEQSILSHDQVLIDAAVVGIASPD